MKLIFPAGSVISPGPHDIHTQRSEEEEVWFMGHLVEIKTHIVDEIHSVNVPEPSEGRRGSFLFLGHTWEVVRDDDLEFWGGITRQEWLQEIHIENARGIHFGVTSGWWEVDSEGNPQRLPIRISVTDMMADNKPLMAHLMVDLDVFKSVGEAKRNGWGKPLQLGRHQLGPKKKRVMVEIVP